MANNKLSAMLKRIAARQTWDLSPEVRRNISFWGGGNGLAGIMGGLEAKEFIQSGNPKKAAFDDIDGPEDDAWAKAVMAMKPAAVVEKGGKGSGNFGHAGRPGKVGGSAKENTQGAPVQPDRNLPIKERNEIYSSIIKDITGERPNWAMTNQLASLEFPVEFLKPLLSDICEQTQTELWEAPVFIPSGSGELPSFEVGDNCTDSAIEAIVDLWAEGQNTRMADLVSVGLNASDQWRLKQFMMERINRGKNYFDVDVLSETADGLGIPEHEAVDWIVDGFTDTPEDIANAREYLDVGVTDPRIAQVFSNKGIGIDKIETFLAQDTTGEAAPRDMLLQQYGYTKSDIETFDILYNLSPGDLVEAGESGLDLTRFRELKSLGAVMEDIPKIDQFGKDYLGTDKIEDLISDTFGYEDDSGLTAKVDHISYMNTSPVDAEESVMVGGSILNKNGGPEGEFTRIIGSNRTIVHDSLSLLYDDGKNKGFGYDYYRHLEEKYLESGMVDSVFIHANVDVGGYAWARMGYDFRLEDEREVFRNDFAATAAAASYPGAQGSDLQGLTDMIAKDINHPWDIAAYTTPDGRRIGKEFLLGTDWQAIKQVDPDSEGWKVGQRYYEAKDDQYGK